MIEVGRPTTRATRSTTGKSIHPASMFAADFSTPSIVTPGSPMPIGVASPSPLDLARRLTIRETEASTASGVDGLGVATRIRSERKRPASTSTTAALIPLPPMSMPIAIRPLAMSGVSSVIDFLRPALKSS